MTQKRENYTMTKRDAMNLVERLRAVRYEDYGGDTIANEAADEIERLRAENTKLLAVLQDEIAEAALREDEG